MSVLGEDVFHVQNPALGALLQWRFVNGYSGARSDAAGCPVPYLFIVLPILLHEETFEPLKSTQRRSGLRAYASKFSSKSRGQSDLLFAIHDRAVQWKRVSLSAFRMALASRLLAIGQSHGLVMPLSHTAPRAGIPASVRQLHQNADKLGGWLSELTLHEVGLTLKVRF